MDKSLQHILKQGENEISEFKTSFGEEAIISLGAFANAKGGSVYVGISDSGEIKGAESVKKLLHNGLMKSKAKLLQ